MTLPWRGSPIGDRLIPIEIKAAGTASTEMARGLTAFHAAAAATDRPGRPTIDAGYVIYTRDAMLPLRNGVTALTFSRL